MNWGVCFGVMGMEPNQNNPMNGSNAPAAQLYFYNITLHSLFPSSISLSFNQIKFNESKMKWLMKLNWWRWLKERELGVMGQRPSAPLNFIPNFLQVFHFVNSAQSNQCCSAERRQANASSLHYSLNYSFFYCLVSFLLLIHWLDCLFIN